MRYSGVHKQMDVDFGSFVNQEVLASGVCGFEIFLQYLKMDIN